MHEVAHLDGHHEGVSQVQGAGDIGRRNDHDKFLCFAVLTGLEEATVLPPGIPALTMPRLYILVGTALRDASLVSLMHCPSNAKPVCVMRLHVRDGKSGWGCSGHPNACAQTLRLLPAL